MAAHGMTPYSFRKGMASAPQLETTNVSFVSRTDEIILDNGES